MRTHSKRIVYACLSAFLSLASGCVVSEQPLSEPKDAKVDERLLGTWRAEDGPKTVFFICSRSDVKHHPAGMVRLEAIEIENAKSSFLRTPYYFFVSELPGHSYMNLVSTFGRLAPIETKDRSSNLAVNRESDEFLATQLKKPLVPFYEFLRFEIARNPGTPERLTTWGLDEQETKKTIDSGRLKGSTDSDGAVLKGSPEQLRAFFESPAGKELFSTGKKYVFVRVK